MMATTFRTFFVLLILLHFHCTTASLSTPTAAPPQPPPPAPPPPPPRSITDHPGPQLGNIVDALIGTQDFANWANVLSAADPSIMPFSATLFIPIDSGSHSAFTSVLGGSLSPLFFLAYHITPQRLSLADLRLLEENSRLPTLLPGFSILVTSNAGSDFTLDGCVITHPDLLLNVAVAVHGISAPFNFTHYGVTGGGRDGRSSTNVGGGVGIGILNDARSPDKAPPSLPVVVPAEKHWAGGSDALRPVLGPISLYAGSFLGLFWGSFSFLDSRVSFFTLLFL